MICVVKTHRGWGEFDWATGLRDSSLPSRARNMDEVATEQEERLEKLRKQKADIQKAFEELCEEDANLNAAIVEAQEVMDDLLEIAHPFKPR